jgi:hypothetical protein
MARGEYGLAMSSWVLMSDVEDRNNILEVDLATAETCWTCDRRTVAGDRLYFYCRGPVSAIFAQGVASGLPFILEEPETAWNGSLMVNVEDLVVTRSISMRTLREIFPEWRRLWFFVGRAKRVPDDLEAVLQDLVAGEYVE